MSIQSAPGTELAKQLSLAIKASQELQVLAEADHWQDFERQFRQRDSLLHAIDAEVTRLLPLSGEDAKLIGGKLQQLRELNDQLLTIAESRKNATVADLAKERGARKAVNAYSKP
ncbi:flagellar protein FliT [Gilvimarinus polysaccharolyticus]|uniref:flagellar protein FliT n=1 Tax=Gilvimarinus polysaccharolyticus TaxID=863921 RepID=UPI0006731063|nr:flagellar protein FliT [Gilvimarinus polysaccharolyticus]